ncbi:amidohydrolase family protein [Paenarthrobacter sp. PH39-S1]|uniref:amidohydrolase n=1 Tax=Paenarthrobacter sp. PH39-S1 TaxID=3046204 RepID=UPI0024BB8C53|nr:amidohydrolase family protein [Paenarthrobacter sp. PH39-S1]MDJ0356781.1 amidohydrolase family protein [Paenarthrobacter sp. PH39-S1]
MPLTLYRNGSVYSAADPLATAMLIDGDTVAWIGTEHAAESLADARMKQVDLQGALVTPGFVDSHVHVTETGMALASVDLTHARSLREVLVLVAAARSATAGTLLGHGWDETGWPERRTPTAADLDRAAGGQDVYLSRIDVHSAVVSSSLAARCALHGLDGWLGDGLVVRAAHAVARDATRTFTDAQRSAHQLRALRAAAAAGYVAVAEMSAPHVGSAEDLRLLADLTDGTSAAPADGMAHTLPQVLPYWGQAVSSTEEARAVLAGLGTPVLGLAGDLNIDGSLGSHSALLRTPYSDTPDTRGMQYLTVQQVAEHLAATSELGIQAGFHVIGDGAMDIAVEGLRQAAQRVGIEAVRSAGHRFEHVEMADAAAIAALSEHSVTVSVQPSFDALWGGPGGMYETRLGSDRFAELNPIAAFFAAGVPVCCGSDSPVTGLNPWASVRAALQHHRSDARISARAAFIGHSRAGWRAAREREPLLGQLVPGAPASFAVWDVEELMVQVADERVQSWSTDPRARTPLLPALDTESDPRCLQTVHRGTELYSGPGFSDEAAGFHQ